MVLVGAAVDDVTGLEFEVAAAEFVAAVDIDDDVEVGDSDDVEVGDVVDDADVVVVGDVVAVADPAPVVSNPGFVVVDTFAGEGLEELHPTTTRPTTATTAKRSSPHRARHDEWGGFIA